MFGTCVRCVGIKKVGGDRMWGGYGAEYEQLFLVQCYSITELSFCQGLFSNERAICRDAQETPVLCNKIFVQFAERGRRWWRKGYFLGEFLCRGGRESRRERQILSAQCMENVLTGFKLWGIMFSTKAKYVGAKAEARFWFLRRLRIFGVRNLSKASTKSKKIQKSYCNYGQDVV